MTDDFEKNIAIINKRWPQLATKLCNKDPSTLNASLIKGLEETISINDIQLTSRHNRKKEASLLLSQIPENSEVINIYGPALGDLQQLTLSNKNLRLIRVYILNETLFSLVLTHTDQSAWLNDPRVLLETASCSADIKYPFIALISELNLAENKYLKCRDHLLSEIQSDFIYQNHQGNSQIIDEQINNNISLIQTDHDVSSLFNSRKNSKAIIVGAGPSLESLYEQLESASKEEDSLVIAVDTAMKALLSHDIKPNLVVTVDHQISEKHLPSKESNNIDLVYFPRMERRVLEAWQGKRYISYSISPIYDKIFKQYPKGRLYAGGSVIHPAIDLAIKMGANRVTLFGCDFAFPNNKTHAEWEAGELGLDYNENNCSVLNGHGETVNTMPNFRSYLCHLETYIKQHPHIKFFNTSRQGASIAGTHYIKDAV